MKGVMTYSVLQIFDGTAQYSESSSTQHQRHKWSKKWQHPIPISDLKIDSDLNYDELQSDNIENCNQCKMSMQQSNCSHFIKYVDLLKHMVLWAITAQDHTV